MIKKKRDFWLPESDYHFTGKEYQGRHRASSLFFCNSFVNAIDVGAHVGTWAVDLQKTFHHVYAFEPVEEHRLCLEKNVDLSKVTIYPYALGDKEGEVTLSQAEEGNSGTVSITEGGKYSSKVMTLDSFGLEDIDYIKVDVEGYELQFLKGAVETIKANKPIINIEIKKTCERFGYSQMDIVNYLTSLGMINCARTIDDWVFKF